eukprot:scaffold8280_cov59-Phaeocystis_antarctica.AAC.5
MAEPTLGSKGAEHFGQHTRSKQFRGGAALGRARGVWDPVSLVKCFSASLEAGAGGPHGLLRGAESRRGAADRRRSGRRRFLRAEPPMRAAQQASTGCERPRAECLENRDGRTG